MDVASWEFVRDTSVAMLEKHYSHILTRKFAHKIAGGAKTACTSAKHSSVLLGY